MKSNFHISQMPNDLIQSGLKVLIVLSACLASPALSVAQSKDHFTDIFDRAARFSPAFEYACSLANPDAVESHLSGLNMVKMASLQGHLTYRDTKELVEILVSKEACILEVQVRGKRHLQDAVLCKLVDVVRSSLNSKRTDCNIKGVKNNRYVEGILSEKGNSNWDSYVKMYAPRSVLFDGTALGGFRFVIRREATS